MNRMQTRPSVVLKVASYSAIALLVLVGLAQGQSTQGGASPAKILYQFPSNGTTLIPRETNIIIRPGDILDPRTVSASVLTVMGTSSGKHTGKLVLSSDKRTLTFAPSVMFTYSEKVTVQLVKGLKTAGGVAIDPYSFWFMISNPPSGRKLGLLSNDLGQVYGDDFVMQASHGIYQLPNLADTVPTLFPTLVPTIIDHPAEGKIFLINFNATTFPTQNKSYLMIVDDSAKPTFARPLRGIGTDFKVQSNGMLTYYDAVTDKYYGLDSNYNVVDSFMMGGGYHSTDLHDMELLPNGHALLICYDTQRVDMTQKVLGGNPQATVVGAIIQEIDDTKQPVFTWRSWDHFQITDETRENLTNEYIDYVHANSIQIDTDGNILLSSRHLDEITKISRDSGGVIWRWGGKNNMFTIIGDTIPFSHQHHARRIDNGHITLFDNGNFRQPVAYSLVLEYDLDEKKMTATLVWSYRHDPDIVTGFMGSAQRLPNGNTFIGWGGPSKPLALSEVRPDGSIAYEMTISDPNVSYRAFRYPWNGKTQLSWQAGVSASTSSESTLELQQCYPNPVQTSSHIVYRLAMTGHADLKLYDLLGRELVTISSGDMAAGYHSADLDASGLAAGVYRYVLTSGNRSVSRQIVVTH